MHRKTKYDLFGFGLALHAALAVRSGLIIVNGLCIYTSSTQVPGTVQDKYDVVLAAARPKAGAPTSRSVLCSPTSNDKYTSGLFLAKQGKLSSVKATSSTSPPPEARR